MKNFELKIYFILTISLCIVSCGNSKGWYPYYKKNLKYGEVHFYNKLSEELFRYTEYGGCLSSRNYFLKEGFTLFHKDICQTCTYPGYPIAEIKFRISSTKVSKEIFTKVIDTIEVNQIFWKVKSFDDYSNEERTNLFQIEHCYLLDFSYRKAEYLLLINDESYLLKITKKSNHPFLIRKLYPNEQLPERYLEIFFDNIRLTSRGLNDDYSYYYEFTGKNFSNRRGDVRLEYFKGL